MIGYRSNRNSRQVADDDRKMIASEPEATTIEDMIDQTTNWSGRQNHPMGIAIYIQVDPGDTMNAISRRAVG